MEWMPVGLAIFGCLALAVANRMMNKAVKMLDECKEIMQDDRVEGLEADLEEAVRVAYGRGATEWTRLNYPAMYERLNGGDAR